MSQPLLDKFALSIAACEEQLSAHRSGRPGDEASARLVEELEDFLSVCRSVLAHYSTPSAQRVPSTGGSGRSDLTRREHEVLYWMAEGKSAEDIAQILSLSEATVMFHYRQVNQRYGTLNRVHTVVEAIRRGALSL